MLTLETLHPLYYTEQKAKIGTIELSLKPNIENQYAVEISSKCLRVRKYYIILFSMNVGFCGSLRSALSVFSDSEKSSFRQGIYISNWHKIEL